MPILEVHKFGGSSVATPESILKIRRILVERYRRFPSPDGCPMAVVVSAMGKTTDGLINLIELARSKQDYSAAFDKLCRVQMVVVEELVPQENRDKVRQVVNGFFTELRTLLQGISTIEEASDRTRARIMSFGERMSAYIISEVMKVEIPGADFLDARPLVRTEGSYLSGIVDFNETDRNIQNHFASNPNKFYIVTGFISTLLGSSGVSETTLLGRGGSDYSASIFGAALRAKLIVIWTDVDGVMTADPRMLGDKVVRVPNLSFEEAMELSFFGAKVIYAPTMGPAIKYQIPLHIKSTFLPEGSGTIVGKGPFKDGNVIRGITSISNISLLLLEGSGMVGATGIAARLFGALTRHKINVILITQASSEHSICVAVEAGPAVTAQKAVQEEFENDIRRGLIDGVTLTTGCAIIAIVGDGMVETPGVMGRVTSALGKQMVNIMCVAQGSSERNISIVVRSEDEKRTLNVIHDVFFGPKGRTLHIFLMGLGHVGCSLLRRLADTAARLQKQLGLVVELNGLADHRKMLFDLKRGIAFDAAAARLESEGETAEPLQFSQKLAATDFGHSVLVDCTAMEDAAQAYKAALSHNITVLTCNPRSAECSFAAHQELVQLSASVAAPSYHCRFLVSPVLPVIQTIKDVLNSGNKVLRITAVFTDPVCNVFRRVSAAKPLSSAAAEVASSLPKTVAGAVFDTRETACRMLVLARVCGKQCEPSSVTAETFDVQLGSPKLDQAVEQRRKGAEQKGKVLRLVGQYDAVSERLTVGLQELEPSHPCASSLECTAVVILTDRSELPIVMQAPGEGPEDVAAALLADLCGIAGAV
eukprot:RCo042012